MAGQESGFGAAGGSPIPADPSEEQSYSATLHDDEQEGAAEQQDPFAAEPGTAMPRNTRPFRAWGAAHEERGPSLWERLKAWVGRLFGRGHEETAEESSVAIADSATPLTETPLDAEGLAEHVDVDNEPHPAAGEVPAANDFGDPWPTHEAASQPAMEEAPPSGEPDPLWDSPQVAQSSSAPREVIDHGSLDVVWTPPSERAEEAEEETDDMEEMKRPSFISRLFARRKKRQELPEDSEAEASAPSAAEVEPSVSDFAEPPSHEDFADSTAAVEPPMYEPEVEEPEPEAPPVAEIRKPSLEHSADDAAALASFLAAAPVAPVEEPAAEAETFTFITPEPEPPAVEVSAESIEVLEPTMPMEAAVEKPLVIDEPPVEEHKPGFFARLFGRKSKPVEEPVEEEPIESAVEEPLVEEPAIEEPAIEEPALEEPAIEAVTEEVVEIEAVDTEAEERARREAEAARWARPDVSTLETEAVPPPAGAPYSSFVDARDDFAEPAATDSRRTEEIDQPVLETTDEGETTDEFEAVPPPSGPDAATAAMPATPPPGGFLGRIFGKKDDDEGEDTLETETTALPQMSAPTATLAQVPSPKDDKLPFVLAKFRMFYNEVIRDKHQKSDVISGFATAIVSASEGQGSDPEFAAALLSKRLSELLELQAAESNWVGGDAVKYYPEAQYAMVCLADETFMTIDWEGRSAWHKHMLEPRMYQTRAADTEFFRRVDKLLREHNPPKGARDLARVYLMVIASGFRGLFREPNLKRPLAEYRRRLYEFSHNEDPLELYARDRKIFPEAEKHILAGKAVGRFTAAQKWMAAVILLLVVYATVSHLAWVKLSAGLKDVMSRVEAPAVPGGAK